MLLLLYWIRDIVIFIFFFLLFCYSFVVTFFMLRAMKISCEVICHLKLISMCFFVAVFENTYQCMNIE